MDRSFVAANARELERMRALVSRLSDRQLGEMVNEYWSVTGVLGHVAFWDGRALYFAGKLQRAEPFTASENEHEDVDWINDSSRPLIHAIAPRALAELAVSIAVETDALVASLSDELLAGLMRRARSTRSAPTTGASTWTRSRLLFDHGLDPDRLLARRVSVLSTSIALPFGC